MKNLIKKLMNISRHYNVFDFVMFKTCLLTIGILLGTYFASFFKDYMIVIWTIAVISYIWMIYKTFVKYYNK